MLSVRRSSRASIESDDRSPPTIRPGMAERTKATVSLGMEPGYGGSVNRIDAKISSNVARAVASSSGNRTVK